MVEFYDIILMFPLILIVVLKIFRLINSRTAILYWFSFLISSSVFALFGNTLFTIMSLLISLIILSILLKMYTVLNGRIHRKNSDNCIALSVSDGTAVFFDGINRFELYVDSDQIIIPGKIYIITKRIDF